MFSRREWGEMCLMTRARAGRPLFSQGALEGLHMTKATAPLGRQEGAGGAQESKNNEFLHPPIFLSLYKLSPLPSGSCNFKFCQIWEKERFSVDAGEVIGLGIRRDEIPVPPGTALISTYIKTLTQAVLLTISRRIHSRTERPLGRTQ